jgi:hypothetical protein
VPAEIYGAPIRVLTPMFSVLDKSYVMVTPEMVGVRVIDLGEVVASLHDRHFDIVRAIDFLLQGH